MSHSRLFTAIICGLTLSLGAAQAANAQSPGGGSLPEAGGRAAPGNPSDPINARGTRDTSATRLRGARRERAAPAAPTAEQITAGAQALATASGLACEVTQATLLGQDQQQQQIYEAACATGPGYIIVGSTPPLAVDCLELAGTAATARARNPEANVGQQCALPANDNGLAVIGGWAREAGVTCTVDQALAIGKSMGGSMIYEVGCANADGYWLEKTSTGWDLQECIQVQASEGACNFTTPAEQAAGFRTKLAGTDAAACDVQTVRLMGRNANGRFYEAKCGAGDGYIARVNNEGVTQQVYPCATAQNIGGGCRLTTTAAAAAPTE